MKYLFIALIALSSLASVGQKPEMHDGKRTSEMHERLQTAHIGFITKELSLTEAEAQAFWPVYNAHKAEKKALMGTRDMKSMHKDQQSMDKLSEKEALVLLKKMTAQQAAMMSLEQSYQSKYLEILPANKVLMLHHAEMQFKKRVMDRFKDGHDARAKKANHGKRSKGSRHPGMSREQ
jgi:hypothetical protein